MLTHCHLSVYLFLSSFFAFFSAVSTVFFPENELLNWLRGSFFLRIHTGAYFSGMFSLWLISGSCTWLCRILIA